MNISIFALFFWALIPQGNGKSQIRVLTLWSALWERSPKFREPKCCKISGLCSRLPLSSNTVCYRNILEKIVQNKGSQCFCLRDIKLRCMEICLPKGMTEIIHFFPVFLPVSFSSGRLSVQHHFAVNMEHHTPLLITSEVKHPIRNSLSPF